MGSNRNTLYPRAALSRLLSCISGNQDNKKPRLSDQESGNKDVTLTSDNIVTERSHPYTITHLLTVEEVKERIARKEVFFSAPFSCTEENDQTTFNVRLKFGAEENDWLSVDLVSLNRRLVVHGCTFTIFDVNLKKQRSNSFEKNSIIEKNAFRGWAKFFPLSDFSLPDNTLCIQTEVIFAGDSSRAATRQFSRRDASFDDDLRKLCSDDTNADVTIIVGERKFKAHKALITARSQYFRSMFDSGMEESRKNEVHIDEADPEIFQHYLEFLYTGLPPTTLLQVAWELLPLSDRFGATTLKEKCEEAIMTFVSSTNCIKALTFARAHCCSSLLDVALKVIRKNQRSLHATAEWEEMKKDPELLSLVVESYAK